MSDLELEEAERVLHDIRVQQRGFASQRSIDYLTIRRSLELKARELFILKGGRPVRKYPHYMTVGECAWLLGWFENGRVLRIPAAAFDPYSISFTYGDLFPTMRYEDGKVYRGQVYTLDEISRVVNSFGLPQQWNPQGDHGPERYVEVQIWADNWRSLCR